MAIFTRCSRCGKRILEGTSCGCKSKRYKDYDRYKNNVEKEFYSSKSWSLVRRKAIDRFNGIDIYVKIKSIWAEILPQIGNVKMLFTNTISAEISHKFIIRANAIEDVTNDMYFVYKKYDLGKQYGESGGD